MKRRITVDIFNDDMFFLLPAIAVERVPHPTVKKNTFVLLLMWFFIKTEIQINAECGK